MKSYRFFLSYFIIPILVISFGCSGNAKAEKPIYFKSLYSSYLNYAGFTKFGTTPTHVRYNCVHIPTPMGVDEDTIRSIFRQNFLVPSVGIGLGLYSRLRNVPFNKQYFYDLRQQHFPNFHSEIDDYVHYFPMALVYGLHFTNLQKENDFINKSILLTKAQLLMFALVYPAKALIGDLRPDGSTYNSFPSGHTTHAFVAAHFLYKEYGKNYPAVAVLGYAIAGGTALFRMLNNRHWSADILAGAGLGILCVNLAYLTHQHRWGKKNPRTNY